MVFIHYSASYPKYLATASMYQSKKEFMTELIDLKLKQR